MALTSKYQFIKPETNDYVNVADLNENMDKVEQALNSKADLEGGKVPDNQLPQYADGNSNGKALDSVKLGGVEANGYAKIESGTWTPILKGSVMDGEFRLGSCIASWNKIGNIVLFSCDVHFFVTTLPQGDYQIAGLPFIVAKGGYFGISYAARGRGENVRRLDSGGLIIGTSSMGLMMRIDDMLYYANIEKLPLDIGSEIVIAGSGYYVTEG